MDIEDSGGATGPWGLWLNWPHLRCLCCKSGRKHCPDAWRQTVWLEYHRPWLCRKGIPLRVHGDAGTVVQGL